MGVFSKSKKAKEVDDFLPQDTGETSGSKMSRSLKRKPKQVVAPKPEINWAMALPETKNFRTSLMMPQLSARFSMLREQDDPTTKVGKANDDSVLFPKRASRMNLFAHNPLTDIAEVESIHSTIRPPFARGDRSYSLSDGYASDDGASIMGRSKPGEGNNLFGGRQKMYRVPSAGESARTLTDSQYRGSGMGKHVYEADVSLSMFQKYRMEAREQERRASSTLEDEEEADAVNSPMTAFSKNRGTQSSTASGPSNRRTSTAATSLTSESPIPRQNSHGVGSKGRTSDSVNGSDESLVKRNPSSESRKNFAFCDGASQPPVPFLGKTLSQSRSAVNLNEKHSRAGMVAPGAFRAVSPPPVSNAQVIASLDLGLQEANQRVASPNRRYQTSSPSSPSPVEDDVDHVYSSSLQPNDRGKATAMGLFNRPRQQFDEQQFLQRQRTMLEGRSSPFPADGRSESRASPETTSSAMRRIDAALASDRESASVPPLNTRSTSAAPSPQPKDTRNFYSLNKPDIVTRPRNQSSLSSGSETVDVKARVQNLIRNQNAELAAFEAKRNVVTASYRGSNVSQGSESLNPSTGTFFNNFDASEDEAERSPQRDSRPRMVPTAIHPALRNGTHDFDFGENVSTTPRIAYRESNVSNGSNTQSMTETTSVRGSARKPSQAKGGDSPTLGPNGLGLSGMIRSHLRHDSDRSSVYPPSPGVPTFPQREVSMASTHTINPPESVHSDPWEFDSASRNQVSSRPESHTSESTPTMSQRAQQAINHSQRQGPCKAQQILGHEAPNGSQEIVSARSWQDELATHHRRGESTETQKERQDFDNELAERQRRIQEKLKGVVEQELRSSSPVGRQDRAPLPQAFHALKQKASMGTMAHAEPPNAQTKAMKMLGLTSRDEVPMRSPNPEMSHKFDDFPSRPAPSQLAQRPPPPVDSNYRNGRRTPADGRPPVDPSATGRRTPADGRGAMDPYASGRRTPAEGRGPMDPYASGRRTPGEIRGPVDPYAGGRRMPAGGREPIDPYANGRRMAEGHSQYPNGSNEDFDRQRQRSATPNSERSRKDRAASNAAEGSRSRQGHYRDEYGSPVNQRHGQTPSPPDMRSHRGAPTPDPYERAPSAASGRPRNGSRPPQAAYMDHRMPPPSPLPPQMNLPPGGGPPRPSPRPPFPPSPMSGLHGSAPFANPNSTSNSAMSSPVLSTNAMADPRGSFGTSGRTGRDRKKSVTRGMISEPLFVSSTSSVPLVDLPNGVPSPRPQPISSPPVPAMNPRRRGPTPDFYGGSQSAQPSPSLPMSPLPHSYESPGQYAHPSQYAVAAAQYANTSHSTSQYLDESGAAGPGKPPPRARNRLRKISSEGGNMASRARQQAFMAEMGKENQKSPRVPMFPNRSATSLGMAQGDGGMF